ncbi:hypothetical protein [Vibrio mexicanus]|uniref:hypothetical protein n=1 Tax=Vibrio mexicanus TaxID=1004326 RepID=UPI00063CD706|nr:hypothetical protein [Vibrio mexicanus]
MSADEHQDLKHQLEDILLPHFARFDGNVSNGYTNINSDNHPYFFQPIYSGHVDLIDFDGLITQRQEYSWWKHSLLKQCVIHFFDDSIAILEMQIDISINSEQEAEYFGSGELDSDLTKLIKQLYNTSIYPKFGLVSDALNAKQLINVIQPKDFKIFNDINYNDKTPSDEAVLWSGRVIFQPPNSPVQQQTMLKQWVGAEDDVEIDRHYIGSGNSLVVEYKEIDSWSRVQRICQAYNAILYLLNTKLKQKYSQLAQYDEKRNTRKRKLNNLLRQSIRSLEHIEFCKLEFNDAHIGTQAYRSVLLSEIIEAWQLNQLQELTIKRANLIKSRIDAMLEEQQAAINKTVEYLLSGIGCLAIIDLMISLVSTSKSLEEDHVPGLFDLFRTMPQDGSSWLSVLLVIAIFVYLYRIRT